MGSLSSHFDTSLSSCWRPLDFTFSSVKFVFFCKLKVKYCLHIYMLLMLSPCKCTLNIWGQCNDKILVNQVHRIVSWFSSLFSPNPTTTKNRSIHALLVKVKKLKAVHFPELCGVVDVLACHGSLSKMTASWSNHVSSCFRIPAI